MVRPGLDQLVNNSFKDLSDTRLGILANQSAINSQGKHILELLKHNKSIDIRAIFTVEHGMRGELQDGEDISNEQDEKIFPLYDSSFNFKFELEIFKKIDLIVIDLQDIGFRYYTYSQSIADLMKVAKKNNIKIVILDRVNPANGATLEGNFIKKGFTSMIGWGPIPQRHGLTLGELATLFNQGLDYVEPIGCELEIIKLTGWDREKYFDETNLPWIKPSPNIENLNSIITYAATCLLETTALSEGRGTNYPFQVFGSPDFNFDKFFTSINKYLKYYSHFANLSETMFTPKHSKFRNELCKGVIINVLDRKTFSPVILGIFIIYALAKSHPKYFTHILNAPENEISRIDKFYGSSLLREYLRGEFQIDRIMSDFEETRVYWENVRKPILLY